MPGVKVTIHGAHEAVALAERLDRAGDGRLRDALYDAIRRANRSVPTELRASALRRLPKRGGLGPNVAAGMAIKMRSARGAGVGITVTATHEYHIGGMDLGKVIHPLFGNKSHWYRQAVRPGWFTSVMEGQEAPTRRAIERAVSKFDV